MTQDRKTE